MDAQEARRVEARLDAADGLAQDVSRLADVQPDVVAVGLDPIDLAGLEEEDAPGRLDDEAFERRRVRVAFAVSFRVARREWRGDLVVNGLASLGF